jgi:hypothetical protein
MSRLGPTAPKATAPEEDFKYVFFAGFRLGSDYPYKYQLYHLRVEAVDLEWPDWLPYIDVKTHSPAVAPNHTRWPIQARVIPGTKAPARVVPGARVAAIFTNDDTVRIAVRRKGWVEVSDQWRAARATRLAPPVQPEPGPLESVVEIAARVVRRGRGAQQAG